MINITSLQVIGVGISIAVVLDATIIRMLLVPAAIKLMGTYNWYCPDWLGAIIDYVGLLESDDKLESLDLLEEQALQALALEAEQVPSKEVVVDLEEA